MKEENRYEDEAEWLRTERKGVELITKRPTD